MVETTTKFLKLNDALKKKGKPPLPSAYCAPSEWRIEISARRFGKSAFREIGETRARDAVIARGCHVDVRRAKPG